MRYGSTLFILVSLVLISNAQGGEKGSFPLASLSDSLDIADKHECVLYLTTQPKKPVPYRVWISTGNGKVELVPDASGVVVVRPSALRKYIKNVMHSDQPKGSMRMSIQIRTKKSTRKTKDVTDYRELVRDWETTARMITAVRDSVKRVGIDVTSDDDLNGKAVLNDMPRTDPVLLEFQDGAVVQFYPNGSGTTVIPIHKTWIDSNPSVSIPETWIDNNPSVSIPEGAKATSDIVDAQFPPSGKPSVPNS